LPGVSSPLAHCLRPSQRSYRVNLLTIDITLSYNDIGMKIGKRSVASFLMVLLNIGWGLSALGVGLTVVLLVLSPFVKGPLEVDAAWLVVGTRMTIPVSFEVDARGHGVAAPSLGIASAELQDVRGFLTFPTQYGPFLIGNAILVLVVFSLALWVIGNLRAVFRTVSDGEPFVAINAARIRAIAYGVMFGEIARTVVTYFENYYAMTNFSAQGLRFVAAPDLNVFAIVLGLIILVIAEVFRAGTRLHEDQSLTI
jgi:Protein of unknown function (DUF2975)